MIVGVGGLDTATHIPKGREVIAGTTQLVDADGRVWRHFGATAGDLPCCRGRRSTFADSPGCRPTWRYW
jgi:hypothetical protein